MLNKKTATIIGISAVTSILTCATIAYLTMTDKYRLEVIMPYKSTKNDEKEVEKIIKKYCTNFKKASTIFDDSADIKYYNISIMRRTNKDKLLNELKTICSYAFIVPRNY